MLDKSKVLFLIFILKSLFIIVNSQNNPLDDNQYNCLINLKNNIGASSDFPTNSYGIIDFCSFTDKITCSNPDLNNKRNVTQIQIKQYNSYSLTIESITCFPVLESFFLDGCLVENTFLNSNNIQKGISVYLDNCNNPSTIVTSLISSNIKKLVLYFKNTIPYNFYLSNIKIDSLIFIIDGSNINVKNDLTSLWKPAQFTLQSVKIDSFNNIFSFNTLNLLQSQDPIDYSFISTISNGSSLQYTYQGSTSVNFPSAALDNVRNPNGTISLTFSLVNTPASMIYLSSIQIKRLALSISNTGFIYNGQIPIILSNGISEFTYSSSYSGYSTLFNFNNTLLTYVDISNVYSPAVLPINYYKLEKPLTLKLSNNKFTGTVDKSWCSVDIELRNNQLSSGLPLCFSCYQYGISLFTGNSLSSLDECSIIPNLIYNSNEKRLYLFGQNLGIKLNFLTISPILTFKPLVYSSLFYSDIEINEPTLYNITFNSIEPKFFTLSSHPVQPIINKVEALFDTNQLVITGSYFSYNQSIIQVDLNNIGCTLDSVSFYQINCTLPSIDKLIINQLLTVRIEQLSIDATLNFSQSINYGCLNNCNYKESSGICNSSIGICQCFKNEIIEYGSDDCSIPSHYITAVSSTTELGGTVDIYGWFSNLNKNIKVILDNQEICSIIYYNSTFINCTIVAGKGTHSITVVQNGISFTGLNMFNYIPIKHQCTNDCSGNGQCNQLNGECNCFEGWYGFNCNYKLFNDTPKSNTTIDDSGSTIINNQNIFFEISILSLIEYDIYGNIVSIYNLTNKWNSTINNSSSSSPSDNDNDNTYTFTQTLQESCKIIFTIQDIKSTKQFNFAGLNLTLDKDSIKLSIKIENYSYKNLLNNLQLILESSVDNNNNNNNNNVDSCNNKNTEINSNEINDNQLLNYVTISKNQKILYGRFINRAISDERETFITTKIISNITNFNSSNKKDSFLIGLNLPTFKNSIIIDPDFSVLVSTSYKSHCDDDDKKRSWVLPVAIVIPCVGVALIIITSAIIYKKNKTRILITKNKLMEGIKMK